MSGKLPYHAKNVVAMMDMKNKMEPRTLAEVMHGPVAPALEAFIAKGLARNPDHRFQSAQEALAVWRQLRPVGAVSVMDGDASAMPPVSDAPPSSEVHTEVMTLVRRPKSETEAVLPATVRDGSAAYQRAAEAMPPPQPAGAVLGTAVGLGATLPTAGTAPQPQIPLPAAAQYGASPHPAADAHRLMAYGKPPPRSGMRTAVALTVGAIALMAVGFAAVAALMHYMR
jgi:serine/threonine-protein kinase